MRTIRHIIQRKRKGIRGSQRRRGAVTAIVSVGLIALLGFCALGVDYGILANDANQLQRAADAAALAGAQILPDHPVQANSRAMAYRVAALNSVPDSSPNTVTVSYNSDYTRCTVVCTRNRPLFFARVLGFTDKQISRSATASKPFQADPRIVPIGVTLNTYNALKANPTQPRTLTYVRPNDTQYALDNFIVFDLRDANSKSATHMKTQLISGAADVKIGNLYTSLNSNDEVPEKNFKPAVESIFQNSANNPWKDTWTGNVATSTGIRYNEIQAGTAPFDNPRVMRLVVNPNEGSPTGGGTWDVPVIDFAPIYLESYNEVSVGGVVTQRSITIRLLTYNTGASGGRTGLVQ